MYTTEEAFEKLKEYGITDNIEVVRRWFRLGKLNGIKPKNRYEGWRIEKDELNEFIRNNALPIILQQQEKIRELEKEINDLKQKLLSTSTEIIQEPIEKTATIVMWLSIDNNNKFVRGKKKARENIESLLAFEYNLRKSDSNHGEYILDVTYTSLEELDNKIESIIQEMHEEADFKNCFIECSLQCKELNKYW